MKFPTTLITTFGVASANFFHADVLAHGLNAMQDEPHHYNEQYFVYHESGYDYEHTDAPYDAHSPLIPPNGIWRGSTLDVSLTDWNGTDVITEWEEPWGMRLDIFRTFRNKSNAKILEDKEVPWIEKGGILFYSIQPEPHWGYYSQEGKDGENRNDEIKKYAEAIKAVDPYKVMVVPGYEPDIYVDTVATDPKKVRGSA